MVGHYKDITAQYTYQIRMKEAGYKQINWLTFGNGFDSYNYNPEVFYNEYMPKSNDAWEWRRAIKKFIKYETDIPQKYADYKIVKAVGYWKDLWAFVYEVFVKEREGVNDAKSNTGDNKDKI